MSYASAGLGQTPAVRVGAAARGDLVLANASLVASKILLQATQKPLSVRAAFVKNKLDAMRPGLEREVVASRRRLIANGKSRDQATFDAMRLAIANARMDAGIESLRSTAAKEYGAEAYSGLGQSGLGQMSANDRATACTVTAGAQVVGGIASIIPVYGTIVGGIISIGSSIAGGQLDCTREQREAAAAAAAAEANLAAVRAATAAAAAAAATTARGSRTRIYLIGGGALVVALGIGYLLLS
jgi:hypothetical protein